MRHMVAVAVGDLIIQCRISLDDVQQGAAQDAINIIGACGSNATDCSCWTRLTFNRHKMVAGYCDGTRRSRAQAVHRTRFHSHLGT